MKINQISQIAKIYGPSSIKKVTPKDESMKAKDNLKISETAKYFQLAYQAAKDAPDIRIEKVENLKARMDSGTYNISAEEVAEKMMPAIFDKQI